MWKMKWTDEEKMLLLFQKKNKKSHNCQKIFITKIVNCQFNIFRNNGVSGIMTTVGQLWPSLRWCIEVNIDKFRVRLNSAFGFLDFCSWVIVQILLKILIQPPIFWGPFNYSSYFWMNGEARYLIYLFVI